MEINPLPSLGNTVGFQHNLNPARKTLSVNSAGALIWTLISNENKQVHQYACSCRCITWTEWNTVRVQVGSVH